MDNQYWGYHVRLDVAGCDHHAITDYDTIYRFSKQLVKDIDMVAYGEPQIVKFGEGDKQGYTLIQLIETSNICAHFVDYNDTGYLDVFSCKEFDVDVVVNLVVDYFKAKSIKKDFKARQA